MTARRPVRVRRITAGTEVVPSTSAGSTKCFQVVSPDTGNIGKVTAKSTISTRPSQKLGSACAATAADSANRSIAVLGRSAAATPTATAITIVTNTALNAHLIV